MSEKTEKKFEPLIKTTTLRDKSVDIKNTMNFERRPLVEEEKKNAADKNKERYAEIERRKRTMKTQKMSLDVMLKLEILDPFLRSTENIDHDGKISINDKIDMLIISYINSRLSTRQLEGFKAIYETYLGE